jgi:hypothetical protein
LQPIVLAKLFAVKTDRLALHCPVKQAKERERNEEPLLRCGKGPSCQPLAFSCGTWVKEREETLQRGHVCALSSSSESDMAVMD